VAAYAYLIICASAGVIGRKFTPLARSNSNYTRILLIPFPRNEFSTHIDVKRVPVASLWHEMSKTVEIIQKVHLNNTVLICIGYFYTGGGF